MRELPTGTVTFVFTDVEGSTRLLNELGTEAYADDGFRTRAPHPQRRPGQRAELAAVPSIQDDARVPKSHKIALPGNPTDGAALKKKTIESLGDRGKVTEFLFDDKKNLAIVTIETDGEEYLSFEEVARLLGDFPPYQVGPINLEKID